MKGSRLLLHGARITGVVSLGAFLFVGCTTVSGPSIMQEMVSLPGTDISFEMVRLQGESLHRGDNPSGETRLKEFSIGRHEVTWGQFLAFYESPRDAEVERFLLLDRWKRTWSDGIPRPHADVEFVYFGAYQFGINNSNFCKAQYPVTSLRWHSAVVYCEWLSKKTGHRFRLPTEAEWEYACRDRSGDAAAAALDESAWYQSNSEGRSQVPGRKKPNAWGLHDMLGNVWEHCLEPHDPPEFRPVLRGGGWDSPRGELKGSTRQRVRWEWYEIDASTPPSLWWLTDGFCQGFRVVRLEDGATPQEREDYRGKIEVKVGKPEVRIGYERRSGGLVRVTGEIRNLGDRTLEEVELTVHYLDPKGLPHLVDVECSSTIGRPTFSKCFPVLVNSYHPGIHRQPLRPSESRPFCVEIPGSFDKEGKVDLKAFGARVSALLFGPR